MHDLYRALVRRAREEPEKIFVIEAETGRTLTYRQCLAAVTAMRRLLGERSLTLALALPGGIEAAVIWLSALTGGHTLVPLAPQATDDEKRRLLHLYQPDVWFIEQEQDVQCLNLAEVTLMTHEACAALIAGAEMQDTQPPEPHVGRVCLTTSGTTGEPKGVILDEPRIAWTAAQIGASHCLTPRDRGLTVLPFFHVNAPVVSLCATLATGGSVVIAARFSRSRFWSWVERYEVTWASIVPTILAMLLTTERPAFLPGRLRFVRTASAPLPVVHLRAFEERFGLPVIETYGLSEAASTVTANPVPPGEHRPGSVGLPCGVELRICHVRGADEGSDDALRDVAPGEVGEVCLRGPSIITSYRGDAGANSFQDGWFRSGDLARRDADGYLYIVGRLRDVINRGGENIAPREIEEVLLAHPGVLDAAVIGRPDALYGEIVVAYVVPREPCAPELEHDLRTYAAQRLSPQKVPADFVLVEAIPRNFSGKIRHRALREGAVVA